MNGIFLLWALHFASVTSMHRIPFLPKEVKNMDFEILQPRIYGGKRAHYSDFPFMILILCKRVDKTWVASSGSLVKENYVLTAATSVKISMIQPKDFFLVGGSENLNDYAMKRMGSQKKQKVNESNFEIQERRGSKIFIHSKFKYNDEQLIHNLAFIKTNKPFTLKFLKPVSVAFEEIKRRKYCTIIGWGLSKQNFILTYAEDKEISTMELGCKYETRNPLICLINDGSSGLCGPDIGSPLLCNKQLIGVASYSISPSLDCSKSIEDYYTMIAGEKDWYEYVVSRGIESNEISSHQLFVCVFASLCTWKNVFN